MKPLNALARWTDHLQQEGDVRASTAQIYTNYVGWYLARTQPSRLSDITKPSVRAFLEDPALPWKAATRQICKAALQHWCDFLGDAGLLHGNPARFRKLRLEALPHALRESRPRGTYSRAQVQALFTAIQARIDRARAQQAAGQCAQAGQRLERWEFWQAALALCVHAGLRFPSDVQCLEWDSLDLEAGTITVWTKKRQHQRVVIPLAPPLAVILQAIPRANGANGERFVFPERVRRVPAKALRLQFRALRAELGLLHLNIHDLRATFIEHCRAAGLSPEQIAALVGHASPRQSLDYGRAPLAQEGRQKLTGHLL